MLIRPPGQWAKKDITLEVNREVTEVDANNRVAYFADGDSVRYQNLIWAGGGYPRELTCHGADLAGVHRVRTKTDIDAIMGDLDGGSRTAVIVGGGYIGLEAAAGLRKRGCDVVLLESLSRVLSRVTGPVVSDFIASVHIAQGVDLRLSCALASIEGTAGRVTEVKLASGEVIQCDIVVVGIGIVPDIGPMATAGAEISNGLVVDEFCRASLPNTYTIGDCAEHANRFSDGSRIRLESVQNANDMAVTAAKHICGIPKPYEAVPWFWSSQYDIKLQTVGLLHGYETSVTRGDPASGSFSVIYLKDGRVIAIDSINAAKDYVQGRKLIEKKAVVDPRILENPSIPLKSMLTTDLV